MKQEGINRAALIVAIVLAMGATASAQRLHLVTKGQGCDLDRKLWTKTVDKTVDTHHLLHLRWVSTFSAFDGCPHSPISGRFSGGTLRFSQLRRAISGISQKALTSTLRVLERDGIVSRRLYASVPPRVEYSLTELGRSLVKLVAGICSWAEAHIEELRIARQIFDRTFRYNGSFLLTTYVKELCHGQACSL